MNSGRFNIWPRQGSEDVSLSLINSGCSIIWTMWRSEDVTWSLINSGCSIIWTMSQVTILRKFLGIFPRNPRKFPGIFLRKIRWKCRQQFRGIFCNPFLGFLGISWIPFRGISRNPFWCISRNPFHGISHNQFQGISLENNLRKCRPNFGKLLGISREKFFRINSWEFPQNYSKDFPKSFLSIFLSKFTNKDLDPKVVNIFTTINVATPTV